MITIGRKRKRGALGPRQIENQDMTSALVTVSPPSKRARGDQNEENENGDDDSKNNTRSNRRREIELDNRGIVNGVQATPNEKTAAEAGLTELKLKKVGEWVGSGLQVEGQIISGSYGGYTKSLDKVQCLSFYPYHQ
eukprot:UN05323